MAFDCCSFVGDWIVMKNQSSFAWMDLHGYFCFIVIDENIFVDKVVNGEKVEQMNSWIGFAFQWRHFFFFLFLKNKLYGLEIGSFYRKCLMLFLWEECPRRGFHWLWVEVWFLLHKLLWHCNYLLRLLRLEVNWRRWWKYQGFVNGLITFVGICAFCNLGGTSICVKHREPTNVGFLRDLWGLKFGNKI